jgi:hypothetical protein
VKNRCGRVPFVDRPNRNGARRRLKAASFYEFTTHYLERLRPVDVLKSY